MEMTEVSRLLGVPDLDETVGRVEGLMADLLGPADASLSEPCLRILRGRGKRLRPALVIAAAACGPRPPDRGTVLAAAAAVEFLHIGSLVHDDIMDHAEHRRGVPSISYREGPNTALLSGDVLFALAGHAAALVSQAAAIESAEAIVALCNGQIREILDNFNPGRSEQSILATIEGKTAALLRASCRLGGICGGMDSQAIHALGAYGFAFGMSFQLVDDVLDFVSNPAVWGEPRRNERAAGG
jgi:geranylgeranyl pyrophosphate synthase